jgi:CHAT domain-containing protein
VPHDALGAPTVDELCAALTPGEVLVEWVRLPGVDEAHHYSAFVLDHACGLRRVDLGDAAPIDDAAQAWRARIGGDAVTARVDRAGDHLRALAWDPLDLPDDAVIYAIPDGGLAAVAFAGLPAAEGGYLLERAHIRYLDAARDLGAPPASPVGRGALVVGDVDLGAARDGLPLPCGLDALPPLPGTAREAADVARRLRRPVTVLTGAAADEASVEALVAGKALVHLATHGVFAPARCYDALPADAAPLSRSGVALAGVNAGGVGADDGLWTAEEIASADLASTSLVVLSACDTGLGDVHAGTGVLGLRHALAAAGARATITSLWALPDDGTAHLIDDLYRRLRSGVQPSDALRAAQLAALAKARARSGEGQPAAWAGLVASGP